MKISALPFYGTMSDAGHRTLQQNLKSISCSKGQIVHNDGDGSFGMIYVEEGLLSVSLLSEDGREVTLLRLRKGSVCFLTAVNTIQGIDFEVTMEAETDTSLLCLSESCLSLLMKTHAAFAEFVHRSVAKIWFQMHSISDLSLPLKKKTVLLSVLIRM